MKMDKNIYDRAKSEVKKQKSFYKNLINWAVFSLFLTFINLFTSSGFFWAAFPIIGWGIGVLFQGLSVFGVPGFSSDWEHKKMEEVLHKLEMESRLKERYHTLKEKEKTETLDSDERLDLEELKKIKKGWDDSELV